MLVDTSDSNLPNTHNKNLLPKARIKMGPPSQPIKNVRCTYPDCMALFETETAMKKHKKNYEFHDYCHKCDEDFEDCDALAEHKIYRPNEHQRACRVCGDEFKTTSGLRRHIEITHKVDQKLPCIGCGDQFYRASLLIEHLEFGHCEKITPQEFHSHIIHKHLITELLKGGPNFDRFMQKISSFNASVDHEEQGGVNLIDQDEEEMREVVFEAIKPEVPELSKGLYDSPYPPLRSQTKSKMSDLCSSFEGATLNDDTDSIAASSTLGAPSTVRSSTWKGSSATTLFPKATKRSDATPSVVASEWSVEQHDREVEKQHGVNLFDTRFWDPSSPDWLSERFFNGLVHKYYCPFVCEQDFDIPADLARHINERHRIMSVTCPRCRKQFPSVTALVAHCESGASKCRIREADDFGKFLDKLTGGFLGVEEKVRPELEETRMVLITNPETGRVERYRPPIATYQQYSSTKPIDYKEKEAPKVVTIGHNLNAPTTKAIRGTGDWGH